MNVKPYPKRFDKRTAAAFAREQAALAGVPSVLVGELVTLPDGNHGVRTEQCPHSLAALVARTGPLPVAEVHALARVLAGALAALHAVGVVHGGVTPRNVLFRADGEPVLTDCGTVLRQASPRDPLHALEYRPPGAIRSGTADEHTDLYGLGATLHHALTGASPHPGRLGERQEERLLRVLNDPVPPLDRPDVPDALATAVADLLSAPPGTVTAADAAALLAPCRAEGFGDFTTTGRTPLYDSSAEPPPARRRAPLVAGVLVAALAVVLGVVLIRVPSAPGQATPDPASPPAPSSSASSPAPAPVLVDLADPVDLGNQVELSWTAAATLDFSIAVAEEGRPTRFVMAERATTKRITVNPVHKYCFQVHASNGVQVHRSEPKPLRGATCRS